MPLLVPAAAAEVSAASSASHASKPSTTSDSAIQWLPLQPVIAPHRASAGVTPAWLRRTMALPAIRRSALELIQGRAMPAHSDAPSSSLAAAASPSSSSVPSVPPLVYAHQRELAMVSPALTPHVQWAGSADATTCVILILQCETTRRALVVHLDGADSRQLTGEVAASTKSSKSKSKSKAKPTAAAGRIACVRDALNLLSAEDCAGGINVHMVGGFQTHRTTAEEREAEEAEERMEAAASQSSSSASAAAVAAASLIDAADDADLHSDQSDGLLLVADILTFLHLYSTSCSALAGSRAVDMRLRTLCVGPLNTQWKAEEAGAMAAAAAADAGAASSSASAVTNAAAASVALSYPRPYLTSLFLHLSTGLMHGHFPLVREDRGPEMILRMVRTSVGEGAQLTAVYEEAKDEFVVRPFEYGRIHAPSLRALLAMPDAQFLAQSSTSPLVEAPNFLPDMRAVYEHLAARPDWRLCFPDPQRFARWKRLDKESNRWIKV